MLKFLLNKNKDLNYGELALKGFINANDKVKFLPQCLGEIKLDDVVLVSAYRRPYKRFFLGDYLDLYEYIKDYFLSEKVLIEELEFSLGIVYVEQTLNDEGNLVEDFACEDYLSDYVTSPIVDNVYLIDFGKWHEDY